MRLPPPSNPKAMEEAKGRTDKRKEKSWNQNEEGRRLSPNLKIKRENKQKVPH